MSQHQDEQIVRIRYVFLTVLVNYQYTQCKNAIIAFATCHRTPNECTQSETTTTATSLPPGGVGWGGCDVLNAANLHSSTGKSPQGGLSTGAGSLGAVTTGGTDLDMKSVDAELLALGSHILCKSSAQCPGRCMPCTSTFAVGV